MKHKHAEMIKAKVDNMDLMLLVKVNGGWKKSQNNLPALIDLDYFLCQPKYVNETIHWLNGGDIEAGHKHLDYQEYEGNRDVSWRPGLWCMRDDFESRIKPKKESRWIIVSKNPGSGIGVAYNQCIGAYNFHSDAVDVRDSLSNKSDLQIIEIEIEVD